MLERTRHLFTPNSNRVIAKIFLPGSKEKIENIYKRIKKILPEEQKALMANVYNKYEKRHRDIRRIFKENFEKVKIKLGLENKFSLEEKLFIGSFFTMEYSIESAALFNPSIVASPNQLKLEEGEQRVIISFRAVGEGHISSIVFRQGVLNINGELSMVGGSNLVEEAAIESNPTFSKGDFTRILAEVGLLDRADLILDDLLEDFTYLELEEAIEKVKSDFKRISDKSDMLTTLLWLVNSNYKIKFHDDTRLSERVIFPISDNEKKGLEDARFVQFFDGKKDVYYATYTAYSGSAIIPQLIETKDFLSFRVNTLHGAGAKNKGLALFPEKVKGKYAMVSRQDSENLYIMYSDNILFWERPILIRKPLYVWENVQIGNCGSPIRTEDGWILLTHGVGSMREYSIGAYLLELEDPTKIIGELKDPLLIPDEHERNGYVPNVVYSCGAILYGDYLQIPYAMSDTRSSIARVEVKELLSRLKQG